MGVTNAIVKVYVTEPDDVLRRHSNIITILRRTAVKVTALSKNLLSHIKGVQENNSIMCVRDR